MSAPNISIVLAEDHHLVRQAIRFLLENEKQLNLVGEASDGMEAVELAQKLSPDILITDLMIPRLHGLDVIQQVRRERPKTRIIALSMHADDHYVSQALRYGALGYVLKKSTIAELLDAIKSVNQGRRYLSPSISEKAIAALLENPGQSTTDIFDSLTDRERLVLQLAAEGLTTGEIAAKLFISPRTAETHRANLMRKINLNSQTDLVRFAIRKGIIST